METSNAENSPTLKSHTPKEDEERDRKIKLALEHLNFEKQYLKKKQQEVQNSDLSCRPWSKDEYNRRVATFKASTWFAKPLDISPLKCALYGYINSNFDTIECELCKVKMTFYLSGEEEKDQQLANNKAKQFAQQLETAHSTVCPWLNNPSPSTFAKFPFSDEEEVEATFKQRYSTFENFTTLSKYFSDFPQELITFVKEDLFQSFLKRCGLVIDEPTESLYLTLSGWQLESNSLYCNQCQVKIPLQPHQGANKRKQIDDGSTSIDITKQHRYFCTWITNEGYHAIEKQLTAPEPSMSNNAPQLNNNQIIDPIREVKKMLSGIV